MKIITHVSRLLTANGLVNKKAPFSTLPQNRRPLTHRQKICKGDYVHDHYANTIFGTGPSTASCGQMVKHNKNYFCLFIPLLELAYRSDR